MYCTVLVFALRVCPSTSLLSNLFSRNHSEMFSAPYVDTRVYSYTQNVTTQSFFPAGISRKIE